MDAGAASPSLPPPEQPHHPEEDGDASAMPTLDREREPDQSQNHKREHAPALCAAAIDTPETATKADQAVDMAATTEGRRKADDVRTASPCPSATETREEDGNAATQGNSRKAPAQEEPTLDGDADTDTDKREEAAGSSSVHGSDGEVRAAEQKEQDDQGPSDDDTVPIEDTVSELSGGEAAYDGHPISPEYGPVTTIEDKEEDRDDETGTRLVNMQEDREEIAMSEAIPVDSTATESRQGGRTSEEEDQEAEQEEEEEDVEQQEDATREDVDRKQKAPEFEPEPSMVSTTCQRRSSIEKRPIVVLSAFDRLPDEIIQQIFEAADPASFASLLLLNAKWRRISQQADLYALQLSRISSYAALHLPLLSIPAGGLSEDEQDARLRKLRRQFACEVKRHLFPAYLRPAVTAVCLVSNSISSSSCPGGEGMQFSPSPRGHHMLAYNSSRIYVLDVRAAAAESMVKRELKIVRRPVSTCITDDGTLLAVLSSEMQVDLYDMRQSPPKRRQSLLLDHSPRTIALSPCGSVLAAAYEGGIEVSSVTPGALPTERRAVKCDAVDSLAFSFDGTQLLGTTVGSAVSNTVILTAPYYDPGSLLEDNNISSLWTTSILFPNTSRDCSHAVLLQYSAQEEASWAFAYDRSFETFRAVRIEDLRNGTTYFTGPVPGPASQAKLLPSTLPAATHHGELVSAGFEGKDIWLYGVPEDLDAAPSSETPPASGGGSHDSTVSVATTGRRNSVPSQRSNSRPQDSSGGGRVPQWQVLCDKFRNNFVAGCKIAVVEGVSSVKWVCGHGNDSTQERLVIAARGAVSNKIMMEEEDIDWIDGGRLTLLDFDYRPSDGERRDVTIEVGTGEAEVLEEERRDMETEVAIVRRRTVAQRRGDHRTTLLRAATTAATSRPTITTTMTTTTTTTTIHPPPPSSRQLAVPEIEDDPLVPRRLGMAGAAAVENVPTSPTLTEDSSAMDEAEALDLPYSHASPRSGQTLRRAATAAAASRRRQPDQPAAGGPAARREHPHESDADNWVPPPPPYQKEAPVPDLPAFMRAPAVGPGGSTIPPRPLLLSHPLAPSALLAPPPLAYGHELQRPVTQPVLPSHQQSHQPHFPNAFVSARQSGGTPPPVSWRELARHTRSASMNTDVSHVTSPSLMSGPRPVSSSSGARLGGVDDDDGLLYYDVSPPDSPTHPLALHSSYDPTGPPAFLSGRGAPVPQHLQHRHDGAGTNISYSEHRLTMLPAVMPPTTSPSAQPPLPPLPADATERIRLAAGGLPPPPSAHQCPPARSMPATLLLSSPSISGPSVPNMRWTTGRAADAGTAPPGSAAVAYAEPATGDVPPLPEPRRLLANAPTWPLSAAVSVRDYRDGDQRPRTEVYESTTSSQVRSGTTSPPLPRPEQLASSERRHHHTRGTHGPGNSGDFRTVPDPVPSGRARADTEPPAPAPAPSFPRPRPPFAYQGFRPSSSGLSAASPDVPLIISTPGGISGAYDGPIARPSSFARPEHPIFAPVARRGAADLQQPSIQRLETLYTDGPEDQRPKSRHSPYPGGGQPKHRSIFGAFWSSSLSLPDGEPRRSKSKRRVKSRGRDTPATVAGIESGGAWGSEPPLPPLPDQRDPAPIWSRSELEPYTLQHEAGGNISGEKKSKSKCVVM